MSETIISAEIIDAPIFCCDNCNNVVESKNDLNTIILDLQNTQLWCDNCTESESFKCQCCADSFCDNVSFQDNNDNPICENCYSDNYFTCESCNQVYDSDCHGQDGYCQTCQDEYESEREEEEEERNQGVIKSRHYHKGKIKCKGILRKKSIYIGFEAEVECKDTDPNRIADSLEDQLSMFMVEEDGSLKNGFEIISHPLTYKEHKANFDKYAKLFSDLSQKGVRSHDTETCGLHFHIDRTYLKKEHRVFMVDFFNKNQTKIEKFARRKENHYAMFNSYEKSRDDRYSAVNLTNDNTVEFRVFRGTLKMETFLASLQFVNMFYLFTISENKGLEWSQFLDFIKKKHAPQLKNYLKLKELN